MPDITITLGTFNPPGTLAVVHGMIEFPRTPVQQLRRPHLQYNSRWVEPVVVALEQNIEFTLWNPNYFAAAGPKIGTASTFTVTGARYVPDGTYNEEYGSGDFYADYLTSGPSGDYVAEDDSGGFFIDGANRTTWIDYTYPIQITLVGCTDGATYEVHGLWPGLSDYEVLRDEGGGIWTATAVAQGTVAGGEGFDGVTSSPVELSQFGEFRLYRNSVLYDVLYVDAGSTSRMAFAAVLEWSPDYDAVDGPALQAINMTLYGPNATLLQTAASAVIPSAAGVKAWSRTSYASQGNLTIA